ncbi:hypothetical protein AVEN_101106-1 [Araneus ventricosus]|uniref:Uncharacterized protein n=1 Tax=Araneus ventricosus TaxID=182803 RepID=A0A4Y2IYR4_ARAVE|nr:hypothetical protein AVEN_101106-1 [Araneus ventricosus]
MQSECPSLSLSVCHVLNLEGINNRIPFPMYFPSPRIKSDIGFCSEEFFNYASVHLAGDWNALAGRESNLEERLGDVHTEAGMEVVYEAMLRIRVGLRVATEELIKDF